MAIGDVNVGQELLNVPMGDMIRSMALAIAEGQWALDKASMTVTELMSGQRLLRDLDSGKLLDRFGKELGAGDQDREPTVIDSRIYFGYAYEEWSLTQVKENNRWSLKKDGKDLSTDEKSKVKSAKDQIDGLKSIVDDNGSASRELSSSELADLRRLLPVKRVPQKVSMIELGFVPTFYQFVDTIIEVRIAITIRGSTENVKSEATGSSTSNEYATQYANNGYWWNYYGYVNANQQRQQNVSTSQVNAAYSSKYSYDVTGSSLLRTKLVPVPPPAILEERIRALMDLERDYLARHPDMENQGFR
jgi:hypothetical protein